MTSPLADYAILVVDDEQDVLRSEALSLRLDGLAQVLTCGDAREVVEIVNREKVGVAVLDINMPHLDGITLLETILASHPDVTAVMLTGRDDVETAVRCMKLGAFDYLVKPVDHVRFVTAVRKAMQHHDLLAHTALLGDRLLAGKLGNPEAFRAIVSADPRVYDICRYIEAVAPTRMPVLITGETGVGKELFAQAVHRASGAKGEFVCVNTAGIDDALLSDTLFGHRRGAFTGADRDREGLIERARQGTLFLDEIGDLRPESQIKLLRLLQEDVYFPVGADTPRRCQARLVAATNVDLTDAQATGRFRRDLFYRLQSHHFHVPPLRERKADIPALAAHFLALAAREVGKKPPSLGAELLTQLQRYDFPGNVRELRGMVTDALVRHRGGPFRIVALANASPLGSKARPAREAFPASTAVSAGDEKPGLAFPDPLPTLQAVELALVAEALRRTGGNKSLAARLLGVTRKTLRLKAESDQEEKT